MKAVSRVAFALLGAKTGKGLAGEAAEKDVKSNHVIKDVVGEHVSL